MTTLMDLSEEVIDIILSYNDISFEDIISLRCVCKKFRWAAKTEECFPKKKFFQRWSSAKKYCDEILKKNEQKQSKENGYKNPRNFIETGISYAKELQNYMRYYIKEEHIDCNNKVPLKINLKFRLSEFSKLLFKRKNYIQILFFMDEIKHLLDQPVRACDLTNGYYYIILLENLRINWRKYILERYIYTEKPYKELLEKCATNLAQQLQLEKNISYSSVNALLKSIALEALNFLRKKHPEHSIFSKSNEYFSHCENNKIDDNYWSETEGTQIMNTLEEYMFDKLKFRTTRSVELKYACIDYVLENKHGNDIILYIIYESVARRLGLRCDIIKSFPLRTFELFWMPKYTFPTDYKKNICLLDEKRKINMRSICLTYCNQSPKGFLKFNNFNTRVIYKKTPAEMLESIIDMKLPMYYTSFPNGSLIHHLKQFVPKTRSKDVKFGVGMIVTHGDESTDCSTGVIIGWHQNSSEFINKMDIISFLIMPLKMCSYFNAGQTYYIILTKSDKMCCVKEDDIALTTPNWIKNKNVYYYFNKFEGTHYVPNKELAEVYPHDAAITAKTIFRG